MFRWKRVPPPVAIFAAVEAAEEEGEKGKDHLSCVFSKSAGVSQIPYPTFKKRYHFMILDSWGDPGCRALQTLLGSGWREREGDQIWLYEWFICVKLYCEAIESHTDGLLLHYFPFNSLLILHHSYLYQWILLIPLRSKQILSTCVSPLNVYLTYCPSPSPPNTADWSCIP
jgi:hypothetical protein